MGSPHRTDPDPSFRENLDPPAGAVIWDVFDRPDQGGRVAHDIGREAVAGRNWQTTGAVLPAIRNRRMVAVDTGAAYAYIDTGKRVRQITVDVVWEPVPNSPLAAAAQTPGTFAIVWSDTMNVGSWNAIHAVFASHQDGNHIYYPSYYVAGVASSLTAGGGGFLNEGVPVDGSTPCRYTLTREGNDLIVDLPNGRTVVTTHAQIGSQTGSLIVVEPIKNTVAGWHEPTITRVVAMR